MKSRRSIIAVVGTVAVFALPTLNAADVLVGAGATFPSPLYQKWIATFGEKFPDATITYRAIGSGAGIDALRNGEVDFAASDVPLSDEAIAAFRGRLHHIPTVVGGVVPIYHLDGAVRDIRFTPEALAGIYLGRIKRWNDPLLTSVNPRMSLPARNIIVVHRSDRSGTTYIWTDYLSKVNPDWRSSIGAVTDARWPIGVSAAGNDGVAGFVEKTADSIGYVEFIYALHGHVSYGAVRNASGRFISADLSSLQAAAATSKASRRELRTSITNPSGADAYPIAAFTYFIVPEAMHDAAKAALMTRFLLWTLTFGQKQSAALGYAALPDDVAKQAIESVSALR